MRPFLVVNPHSANGQTGKRWPEMKAHAHRALGDFGHAFTERALHARELAQRALEDGYDCIVAVGGDGTINEVVNGMMAAAAGSGAALGVIPRGTGGDFRRTFFWEDDLKTSFERLNADARRPLDLGRVDFLTHEGQRGTRYFANVCSFGISGMVADTVNQGARALGGRLGFLWATGKSLLRYHDRKVRLFLDDQPPEEAAITCVAVANGRYFGGGMCVAPKADPSDGVFDVTCWMGYGLWDFTVKGRTLFNGDHVKLSGTRTFRCRTLRAESEREVLLDCDGEAPGKLPIQISMVPGALQLVC